MGCGKIAGKDSEMEMRMAFVRNREKTMQLNASLPHGQCCKKDWAEEPS